jgi:hypothetical protein
MFFLGVPFGSGFSLQSFLLRLPANQKRISSSIPNANAIVNRIKYKIIQPKN